MNFTYENRGSSTFLVYRVDAGETIDSTCLGMLTNNTIEGFIKTSFSQLDGEQYLHYNISAKISLRDYFSNAVSRNMLLSVLRGIATALAAAEDYMIGYEHILLDWEHIYVNISTKEAFLMCLPINGARKEKTELAVFLKNILMSIRPNPEESGDHLGALLNYLNSTVTVIPEELVEVLEKLEKPTLKKRQTMEKQGLAEAAQSDEVPYRHIDKEVLRETPIPPVTPPVSPKLADVSVPVVNEKQAVSEPKMSLYKLLRNYSKENAEIYRRQKEEKKDAKSAKQEKEVKKETKQKKKEKQPKKEKETKKAEPQGFSFAIPGQDAPYKEQAVQEVPKKNEVPLIPVVEKKEIVIEPQKQQVIYRGESADFGDTEYKSADYSMDDGATEIRGSEAVSRQLFPHLVRKSNNERIPLNKPIFRLGRDVDFNDYAIVENRYVGHTHCHIVTEDGNYYVVDDNSKNHTRVNGQVIPSGQKIKVAHEDVIALDTEEFEFRLF